MDAGSSRPFVVALYGGGLYLHEDDDDDGTVMYRVSKSVSHPNQAVRVYFNNHNFNK